MKLLILILVVFLGVSRNSAQITSIIDVVTSNIDINAPSDEITFRCYTFCVGTTCNLLNGTVDWYVKINETLTNTSTSTITNFITTTNISYYNKTLYSFLNESMWTPYINHEISCVIKPSSQPIRFSSAWYYAGVYCSLENTPSFNFQSNNLISVVVNEGETVGKKITCTTYLPVTCVNNNTTSCDLNVYLNYRYKNLFNRVIQRKCNKIENEVYECFNKSCIRTFLKNPYNDENLTKATWTLSASFESGNLNYQTEEYFIDFISNKNSINLRPIWAKIRFPAIKFSFKPVNRPVYISAYCYNDPHCKTFDGEKFELHQEGEFLMFENVDLSTRIHMIAKPCYPSLYPTYPYCVEEIYFQAMHELLKIKNNQNYLLYSNLKTNEYDLPVLWSANEATNFMEVFIATKTDDTFDIASNFGVLLRIHLYKNDDILRMWGYEVVPSKADFGHISGLFGNWNNDTNDDLKYLKGTNTKAQNITIFFRSFDALIASNRIPSFSQKRFYGFTNNNYEQKTNDDNEFDNCDCLNKNSTETVDQCFKGQNQVTFNKNVKKVKKSNNFYDGSNQINLLNSLASSPSIKTLANFDLNKILENKFEVGSSKLKNVLNQAAKTNNQTCLTLLNGDTSLVQCNSLGIINLNDIISQCISDYNAIPNTDWVYGYLESAKNKCKFTFKSDTNFMVDDGNGNRVLNEASKVLLASLCSNNCSSHGTCSIFGLCNCETNYYGSDCSQNANDTPILLNSTYTNNMFDYSSSSIKDVLLIVKKFLSNNNNDQNGVAKISVLNNKTSTNPLSTTIVLPSSVNLNLIYVNLTKISNSVASQGYYFLNLSISNDNATYTSPLTVLAYNSQTHTCTTNFTCMKKESTSIISGSHTLNCAMFNTILISFLLIILSKMI